MRHRIPSWNRTAIALVAVLALVLAACGGGDADTEPDGSGDESISQDQIDEAMQTPTQLTFWSWLPDIDIAIAAFEEKYPAIDIVLENPAGAGGEQDRVLRTALEAGTGLPDVVQLQQASVASYVLSDDLLDLAPHGAAALRDGFVDSAWASVQYGEQIVAIPQDTGPMALLLRQDLWESAGLTDYPTTWEEFADAAVTYKENTGEYLTNFSLIQYNALPNQKGQVMYDWSGGEDVNIAIDNPDVLSVIDFWQDLIDQDVVGTDAEFTDAWYQAIARGKYASWLTAAWGPIFLEGTAASTAGNWRAVPLPQWNADDPVGVNAGGSVNAVLNSTENPIAAAQFVMYINADPESAALLSSDVGLFPATVALLADDEWRNRPDDFFGGQATNAVFAEAATISKPLVTPPFSDFIGSSGIDTVAAALAEGSDISTAFSEWQDQVVTFAEGQGFTVEGG